MSLSCHLNWSYGHSRHRHCPALSWVQQAALPACAVGPQLWGSSCGTCWVPGGPGSTQSCQAGARAVAAAVCDIETCCPWQSEAQAARECLGLRGDFRVL